MSDLSKRVFLLVEFLLCSWLTKRILGLVPALVGLKNDDLIVLNAEMVKTLSFFSSSRVCRKLLASLL